MTNSPTTHPISIPRLPNFHQPALNSQFTGTPIAPTPFRWQPPRIVRFQKLALLCIVNRPERLCLERSHASTVVKRKFDAINTGLFAQDVSNAESSVFTRCRLLRQALACFTLRILVCLRLDL